MDTLKEQAQEYSDNLSCLMITYPSTHGVYEENIIQVTEYHH